LFQEIPLILHFKTVKKTLIMKLFLALYSVFEMCALTLREELKPKANSTNLT